jgi:hypothetical protein
VKPQGSLPLTQQLITGTYSLLLLLTAIGLSLGGSSPTQVQTKIKITQNNKTTTIYQNNTKQQNNYNISK